MSQPSVYIETSVVSYLAARPSRDLIVAAHQQLTSDWWHNQREQYRLFISEIVFAEARGGDTEFAARRIEFLQGVSMLETNQQAIDLAGNLVKRGAVPSKALRDAFHIAICV